MTKPSYNERYLVQEIVHIHKILANPSRLRILLLLADAPYNVSEISLKLGLEQSATSHQLSILRTHQLVKQDRSGRSIIYKIGDKHILQLLALSVSHAQELEGTQLHDTKS
ncbi:ArsR/SmtB family transcription factor [Lactococcus insecticola]|uniref:Transcriptional regulator n=1 Tax=Pseudolactococcus insecticola TaxID=2709158 RepID=A0A6A0B2U4_9LACT|nr:metalloregulator ArsR/SmtB family transcription factor [Lactococcus insecticola]GFH39630.1 transcriptional regulator [Lactococcus insecticola]